MPLLIASADTKPADWLVEGVRGFGESVLSLVPGGFQAYVRVFHPAYRGGGEELPIAWSEIALANGTQAHAGMQLCALTRAYRFEGEGQPDVFERPPDEGSLPVGIDVVLAAVLARHTDSQHCWFGVWNGFGATRADVSAAPIFHLPHRDYHLLRGPTSAVTETVLDQPWRQSPNLWWPEDQAWCACTEIDLKTTYIGCDAACANELLAQTDIEALEIDPSYGISWRSDLINPPLSTPEPAE